MISKLSSLFRKLVAGPGARPARRPDRPGEHANCVRDPRAPRLVQGPTRPGDDEARILVDRGRDDARDGHPGDLRRPGGQERVLGQEPLRVRPQQDLVGPGTGSGVQVRWKRPTSRPSRRRWPISRRSSKNLVDNVKKLDDAMLIDAGRLAPVSRHGPGDSRLCSSAWPAIRKAIALDGPQQLMDFTAPHRPLWPPRSPMLTRPRRCPCPAGSDAAPVVRTSAVLPCPPPTGLAKSEAEAELATVPDRLSDRSPRCSL